jgi:hypothetical protein
VELLISLRGLGPVAAARGCQPQVADARVWRPVAWRHITAVRWPRPIVRPRAGNESRGVRMLRVMTLEEHPVKPPPSTQRPQCG